MKSLIFISIYTCIAVSSTVQAGFFEACKHPHRDNLMLSLYLATGGDPLDLQLLEQIEPACYKAHLKLQSMVQLSLKSQGLKDIHSLNLIVADIEVLDLSHNYIATFPEDILSQLWSLKSLNLSQNRFLSFPTSVISSESITHLNLANNRIKETPLELGMMQQLKSLNLRSNRLIKIPDASSLPIGLEYLDLSDNPIISLEGIKSLPKSLKTLKLCGLPQNQVKAMIINNNFTEGFRFIAGDCTAAQQISVGDGYGCTLLASGQTSCWSYGKSFRPLNHTATSKYQPFPLEQAQDFAQIDLGLIHSCALLNSGKVKCRGLGSQGQLGHGELSNKSKFAQEVIGIDNAVQVAVGGIHSCALLSHGEIKCWGSNIYGQLGHKKEKDEDEEQSETEDEEQSETEAKDKLKPVTVFGINNAKQIALGYWHSCALLTSGEIKCWGQGKDGQLGDGHKKDRYKPVVVDGIDNATQIALGGYHSCAITGSNTVKCWGSNQQLQLSSGSKDHITKHVRVPNLVGVKQIALQESRSCALLTSGIIKCWGDVAVRNSDDQYHKGLPRPVYGINNATQVAIHRDYSCALLASGKPTCWQEDPSSYVLSSYSSVFNPQIDPMEIRGFSGWSKPE